MLFENRAIERYRDIVGILGAIGHWCVVSYGILLVLFLTVVVFGNLKY